MSVDINDLTTYGAISDIPSWQLPPEAWTLAHNMRARDDAMEKMTGHSQIFGTPGVAPHFALPISALSQNWILYTSLTKGYVWDGATHTDITRTSGGDYTAANTRDWNGTILGGIPILNNGGDVPQYWASYSTGTKLANLPNWPSTNRARVIKALGPHLIAAGLTKSGVAAPHLVTNSHPAAPGSVPASWDVSDPTVDARENDLPDVESGIITTMEGLRGQMYVYKEASAWRVRFIGGRFVFAYDRFLETIGSFVQCGVCVLGDGVRHAVWGQDDIIVHNGQSANSILDKKWKKTLFNAIDTANYRNCFCFCSYETDEVFFCYPESGFTNPNKALVWRYRESGDGAFTTADINFRNAANGTVETSDTATWDSDNEVWNSDLTTWNTSSRRKTILLDTDATKFEQFNSTEQRNGVNFESTLQRTGLAVMGRKRNGEWIVDVETRKQVTRLWPKIQGGPVRIRMGYQERVDGPITWLPSQNFDPSTQRFADFVFSGMAIAIEFSSNANVTWKLLGYKIELVPLGKF